MHAIAIRVSRGRFYVKSCIKGTHRIRKFACGKSAADKRKRDWLKRGFRNVFGKYLLITNTLSSGILMSAGDLIQQEIEYLRTGKHKNSLDWHRNIHMGLVGTFMGPFCHFFYLLLDKYIPGTKISSIAKKIILDQTIASPVCILIFFFGMNYLNNTDFNESKAELKEKFWIIYAVLFCRIIFIVGHVLHGTLFLLQTIYFIFLGLFQVDCSIWIPFQFFNFYCISSEYRVIYVNIITMCYNIFLSFAKHYESSSVK